MKIIATIIRNGIIKGIPEGTKVPEKPTLRGLACLEDCNGECGDICPVIAGAKQHNEIENGKYQDAVQVLWDSSVEWEDQEYMSTTLKDSGYAILQVRHGSGWYDLPNQKFGREPDGIYQTVIKDGIYPLEGVNADVIYQKEVVPTTYPVWFDCPKQMYDSQMKYGTFKVRSVLRLIPQPNSEPLDTTPFETAYRQVMAKPSCEGTEASETTNFEKHGIIPSEKLENWGVGVDEKKEPETHDCTDYAKINCRCPEGVCSYKFVSSGVSEGEPNQVLWEQVIELLRAGSSDVKERAAEMSKLFHIQKLKA